MKMMANDGVMLNKNESIQIFFEGSQNIIQVSGNSKVIWIQDKDTDEVRKGKYRMVFVPEK
jgi:hypothetical protein